MPVYKTILFVVGIIVATCFAEPVGFDGVEFVVAFDLDTRATHITNYTGNTTYECDQGKTVERLGKNGTAERVLCSSYAKGGQNYGRCNYDYGACETCTCACRHTQCRILNCGDSIVDANEECDNPSPGCLHNCSVATGWVCTDLCRDAWWECDSIYQSHYNKPAKADVCTATGHTAPVDNSSDVVIQSQSTNASVQAVPPSVSPEPPPSAPPSPPPNLLPSIPPTPPPPYYVQSSTARSSTRGTDNTAFAIKQEGIGDSVPTTYQRRFLLSNSGAHVEQSEWSDFSHADTVLEHETSKFLKIPNASISKLQALRTSDLRYRRVSFTIQTSAHHEVHRLETAISVDAILAILRIVFDDSYVVRNIVIDMKSLPPSPTQTPPVPTSPTPTVQRAYSTLVEFDMDYTVSQLTPVMLEIIHSTMSRTLGIAPDRVTRLTASVRIFPSRRLLSVSASFTIYSDTSHEAPVITSLLLNSMLSEATGANISTSNVQITQTYRPPVRVQSSRNIVETVSESVPYSVGFGVSIVFVVVLVVIFWFCCCKKKSKQCDDGKLCPQHQYAPLTRKR